MPSPKQQWVHTFDTMSLGWMQGRLLSAEVESRKEMDLLKEMDGDDSGWQHVLCLWDAIWEGSSGLHQQMVERTWLSFLCRQYSGASCDRAVRGLTEEQ